MFNAFYASVLDTDGAWDQQNPELEDHDCVNDKLPAKNNCVLNLLLQMHAYTSMGPDGIHPMELKKLTDVIMRTLLFFSSLVNMDWFQLNGN